MAVWEGAAWSSAHPLVGQQSRGHQGSVPTLLNPLLWWATIPFCSLSGFSDRAESFLHAVGHGDLCDHTGFLLDKAFDTPCFNRERNQGTGTPVPVVS